MMQVVGRVSQAMDSVQIYAERRVWRDYHCQSVFVQVEILPSNAVSGNRVEAVLIDPYKKS